MIETEGFFLPRAVYLLVQMIGFAAAGVIIAILHFP